MSHYDFFYRGPVSLIAHGIPASETLSGCHVTLEHPWVLYHFTFSKCYYNTRKAASAFWHCYATFYNKTQIGVIDVRVSQYSQSQIVTNYNESWAMIHCDLLWHGHCQPDDSTWHPSIWNLEWASCNTWTPLGIISHFCCITFSKCYYNTRKAASAIWHCYATFYNKTL